MIDHPYTDAAVRIVVEALATTAFAQTLEDDAHAVLAALAAECLLVTPRIEQDARMLGRAYIWHRPGGEPLVLNPAEVDVVLPLDSVTQRSEGQDSPRAGNQSSAATAVERTDMDGVTHRD